MTMDLQFPNGSKQSATMYGISSLFADVGFDVPQDTVLARHFAFSFAYQ